MKAVRLRKFGKALTPVKLRQQIGHPTCRCHSFKSETVRRRIRTQGHAHDLSHRGLIRLLPPEVERSLNLFGVELHPLPTNLHERLFEFSQRRQFFPRQYFVAKRDLPLKLGDYVKREIA